MSLIKRLFEIGLTLPILVSCSQSVSDITQTQVPQSPTSIVRTTPLPTSTTTPIVRNTIAPQVTSRISTPTPTIRIQTPQSAPSPNTVHRRHIVFVGGLCTTNPKNDFSELEDWLVKNMNYSYSDFEYFNYNPSGISGEPYSQDETLKSVDGEGGSSQIFRNFVIKLSTKYRNDEFYVVGHSLGGNVALYAIDQYKDLQRIIRGVLTIDSPLRGEGLLKLNAGRIFTCVRDYEDRNNKIPIPVLVDVKRDSTVMTTITGTNYPSTGVRVVNLSNTYDPILLSDDYPAGVIGTLPNGLVYMLSSGINLSKDAVNRVAENVGTILDQHGRLLKINSLQKLGDKEAVGYIQEAMKCTMAGEYTCAYR